MNQTKELSFAALLDESWVDHKFDPNQIVEVEVIGVDDKHVTLSIFPTVEGVVATREFAQRPQLNEKVKVIVSALDDGYGSVDVSHTKAIESESRELIKEAIENRTIVEVKIKSSMRAGLITQFNSVEGFLPKSHFIGQHDDPTLVGQTIKVVPIGTDEGKGNIIVSQKEALILERGGKIEALEGDVKVGDMLEGVVKNIMPFGAFVDLGGRDCLIHVTDMTWNPIDVKPNELLEVGQRVKGLINKADDRGYLFMSLRHSDMTPWNNFKANNKVGDKVQGTVYKVENKKDLLVVVDGILGTIPFREISWNFPKNSELKSYIGKQVEVKITSFDDTEGVEKVNLSLKAAQPNPWEKASDELVQDRIVQAPIKSKTEHNVFVKVAEGVDAIVPFREIDWMNPQRKLNALNVGDVVPVKLINVDHEEQKVTASIKLCDANPYAGLERDKVVEAVITGFTRDGSGVELEITEVDGEDKKIKAFSSARYATSMSSMKASEYHEVGDKISARVINIGADKVLLDLRSKSMDFHANSNQKNNSMSQAFAEANS